MENSSEKYRISLRNAFILLGSMMSVMAGATISPALPEMAAYFEGQPNSEFLVKIMLTVPSLFIAIFSPLAGFGLDRWGRKAMLLPAIALYGIAGASGFFLDDLYLILLGRAFLGIAVAFIMSGFITVIGDLFEGERLNRFMGIQAAFMSFGGVVFLMFGGILADVEWRHLFLLYLFAFMIFPGIALFLRETRSPEADRSKREIPAGKIIKSAGWIYTLAFFMQAIFLMVPVQLPFVFADADISNTNMGFSLSFWILCSAVISLFYKKFRSRFSFNAIFSIAFLIWAAGYFLIAININYWVLMAGLMLSGMGNGLALPNIKVNLLAVVDMQYRGRAVGILTMFFYFGQFFSPILFSVAFGDSIKAGFAGVAGLMAAGAVLFFYMSAGKSKNK
jgi:MFS family permease